MFIKNKVAILLMLLTFFIFNVVAFKYYLSLKYVSIDKTFSPFLFKGKKPGLEYSCRIELTSERKWYDQSSISVITGSAPYELFLFLNHQNAIDIEVDRVIFECDGIIYQCENLKFKKDFDSSTKTHYFTIRKIFIPFVENKKLKVTYNLIIKDNNGKFKKEQINAYFIPTVKVETGFKFIARM